MLGNKTTLAVLFILCIVFFLHNKQRTENIKNPDNPPIIVPEPIPAPEPSPVVVENGCDLSLAKALKDNKKLLIIFVADWCGFCKSLKNDLSNINSADEYVVCLLNIDDSSNEELINHFAIKMLPTSIMVDPEKNKEIKRISGYNREKYLLWLK